MKKFLNLSKKFTRNRTSDVPFYRIVLTGGPCAGKSSALSLLSERLGNLGYNVYTVSEAATLLFLGGAKFYPEMTKNQLLTFESALIKTQMSLENSFVEIAKSSEKPSIIICDRGCMDATAYMSKEDSQAMFDINDWSLTKLRDQRYDCVIHLVTAAIGAEKFYQNANNTTRKETPEQAREIDYKLREAWNGHYNFHIVDNKTSFPEKVNRVIKVVSKLIGLPKAISTRRKFLLKKGFQIPQIFPMNYEVLDIEQYILSDDDPATQVRIRKRGQKGAYTYSVSVKRCLGPNEETSTFRPITPRNYVTMINQQDPKFSRVRKTMYSFVYKEHYYELVTFVEPQVGITILYLETEEKGFIDLPPFLQNDIEKEVTNDSKYSTQTIAKK